MKKNWAKWFFLACTFMVLGMPAWAVELQLNGSYEIQGRYYVQPDIIDAKTDGAVAAIGSQAIVRAPLLGINLGGLTEDPYVPEGAIEDTVNSDAYLKHYFYLDPTLIINDRISIKSNIVAFENQLSGDEYGRTDEFTGPREYDHYDRYTIFRIDNLWADVTTDYGKFIFGKTPQFLGVGYFIRLPDLEGWTFGLIWDKQDENGGDQENLDSMSDRADEDHLTLLTKYEAQDLTVSTTLTYIWSGKDYASTSLWAPHFEATYKMDNITITGFLKYVVGTYVDTGSYFGSTYSLADDLEFNSPSPYPEVSAGLDLLTPKLTVAWAKGADEPTMVSGWFEDDQDFGTWLMNDVSDRYARYFETPTGNTYDALGDPDLDDYSFSNIVLVRLGADADLSEKLTLTGNVIWAQRENTDFLENWDTRNGTLNILNQDAFKVGGPAATALGFTSKNKVDKNLGIELNAKASYKVQDNFSVALQAAYYMPGDFYESALENAFGAGDTGLEIEDEYAARWIATVTF